MHELENPDMEVATEMIGGDASILPTIIEAFLEEVPELISTMGGALEARDPKGFCKAVHTLKSTLQVFGVPNTVSLTQNLEETSREGSLDAADQEFGQLTGQVDHMIKLLNEYLANNK